jgi:hypothetical protein
MVNQIKEYLKLHLLSLEQDEEEIKHFFNTYEGDFDTDEYRQMEIEDIVNLGELKATRHILSYIDELDNALYERV